MRSVNKVILIGNLTRDPELRQTPNGQNVCTFGIATNRQWVTKEGGKHNLAEFHEVVVWSRLAEICEQFLKKGNLVYVEGYLKTRSWDTPEGVRKFKTEIIIQDMIKLEKRKMEESEKEEEYIPEGEMLAEEPAEKEAAAKEEAPAKEKEPEEKEAPPAKEEEEEEEEAPAAEEKKGSKKKEVDIDEDLGL